MAGPGRDLLGIGQVEISCHACTCTALSLEVNMETAKETVRKILDRISDDSTFEDIQYHIYVREKIEKGLNDVAENRVLTQEEVEQRMDKWFGK